ncbi:rhodanese-like domain-containing protein [Rhodopirellula sp. P2]|uniref:rhodanese-like domain-containing protein n=1 Tax=Rhodopirellula sp. P2 TaxID=2127060 RepID=UPI0023685686|nr:rhodanese-like domain-containing protein [Rhodopirellula sp. P2]WDQ17195.1 rhodanese-like domain-containing protein [Rhodopirellula sp. P2]
MIWLSEQFVLWLNRIAPFIGLTRVEEISTEELARRLEQNDPSIVLVDVRSEPERNVSHIPGSISRDEFQSRQREFQNRTVVASCTIGGRSWIFAQRCLRRGMKARNYRSGILGWCESGGELVSADGTRTQRVHTHNRFLRAPAGYESATKRHTTASKASE